VHQFERRILPWMRVWMLLLISMAVTAVAGFRSSRLPHVQGAVPAWTFPLLWISIAAVLAMVPILWWLDL
jgi:hypothetical protein